MMKETQLLKGVLDGCVLAIIAQEEIYGYDLIQRLRASGFEQIIGGTVYPLLQKLEKNGLILGTIRPQPSGPSRKYFVITVLGQNYLRQFEEQWGTIVQRVDKILAERSEENGKS